MTVPFHQSFGEAINFSDTCEQFALATGDAQTYTLPGTNSKKYRLEFSYISTSNVWVGYNVAATVPGAGSKTSTSALEFRPGIRYAIGGDVISLITPDASAYVGISVLGIPN